jgi:AIPR protein
MEKVTKTDLKNEIADMRERFPRLQDSDLFVAWFLKAYVTEKEQEGVASLVGGSHDKSLDAVYLDDPSKTVVIVQGKYHQKLNAALEHRADVTAFTQLGQTLSDRKALSAYLKDLDVAAAGKIETAVNRLRSRDYRLQLYYVTTGRCSHALASEANRIARHADIFTSIDIFDGKRVMRLLSDYLDGVAPPIPLLELEMESGHAIKLGGILQRFDGATGIESWVFPVNVRHIAKMYGQAGIRLFARNVRGFLSGSKINKNLEKTLESEPEFFWYYNNGITIICDSAERSSRSGRNMIKVVNPQVINGQQTTRILHQYGVRNSKPTVLVRVISVPRETDQDSSRFENLVSKIVAATNWQNAISASDLMANDRTQIQIERNLRKFDYYYVGKRESKGEARRRSGVRHAEFIKKAELAQAVAACDLDPSIVREGKEQLFEERYYAQVFPNSDPYFYLPRYWLVWYFSRTARGYPERAYAKWLVTHFVWQYLSTILRSRVLKDVFADKEFESFYKTCDAAFKAALAFYRARRGKGATAIDVSSFFQRRGLHTEFERFWKKVPAMHRKQFKGGLERFTRELNAKGNE